LPETLPADKKRYQKTARGYGSGSRVLQSCATAPRGAKQSENRAAAKRSKAAGIAPLFSGCLRRGRQPEKQTLPFDVRMWLFFVSAPPAHV